MIWGGGGGVRVCFANVSADDPNTHFSCLVENQTKGNGQRL